MCVQFLSEISKLQQKLKDSQHQLLLVEARVSDKKLLEEELKEAWDNEARVQQEPHEEQLKRYPELGKACAACGGQVLGQQTVLGQLSRYILQLHAWPEAGSQSLHCWFHLLSLLLTCQCPWQSSTGSPL